LAHLTPAQARAFAIADNRLTENSNWDERLLGEVFRDLVALDLDFSLEVAGFSIGDIDLRIEGLSTPVHSEESDAADLLPESLSAAVCQPGDLWQLGKHRLLCGNALESSSYQLLMGRTLAWLVFTDPPYNVPIVGHVSGNGKVPATELELLVISRIQALLTSPQELSSACEHTVLPGFDFTRLVAAAQELAAKWSEFSSRQSAELVRRVGRRIVLREAELEITIDLAALAAALESGASGNCVVENGKSSHSEHLFTLSCSFRPSRRRGELRLVMPSSQSIANNSNHSILRAVARALQWKERIIAGDIYSKEQLGLRQVSMPAM
jgi:hypothetical protein